MSGGKFGERIERVRGKLWFSALLNLLVLGFMLLLMTPSFDTNDDTTIREFINGARTVSDAHLVFQNIILGFLYKLLYRLPGNIPWYTVFQYTVLFFSFTAVTYVVLKKLKGPAGFWVVSVLLTFFAYEGYITVQYTKTAGLAACAGVFLLFYAAEAGPGGRILWRAFAGGLLLGCVGSMLRFRQAVACTALMTGIGLFLLLRILREGRRNFMRGFLPYLKVFALFSLCVFALKGVDLLAYSDGSRWGDYVEFSNLRTQLMDYGFPDFAGNQEVYEEVGIDENAFRLYTNWNINDPEKLSSEVWTRLMEAKPQERLSKALILNFLKEFPAKYFDTWTFYCFLLMGVLWLFYGYHRREDILAVLYQIALFGLFYLYMYFSGRYGYERVDVGLWFAMSLAAVWLLDPDRFRPSSRAAVLSALGVLLLSQSVWRDSWRIYHTEDAADRAKVREAYEEISQDKEHLYFTKAGVLSTYNAYGIFEEPPAGVLDNICLMGGWDCDIPVSVDVMKAYGVENPYRDMIDNPRVFLIDNNIDMTMEYIRKYYAPNAKAVKKKKINGRKVYQIVTKKKKGKQK